MRPSRPSSTAQLIAAAMLILARDQRFATMISPEAIQIARAALGHSTRSWRLLARAAPSRPGRSVSAAVERLILPGITLHYAARKRHLEHLARTAFADGFTRIIVLGAGLDALAYRMATIGATCIELDHPATQHLKRRALEELISPAPGTLSLIPADLSKFLPQLPGDDSAPTLIIAEGLLMYFPEAAVESLLAQLLALHPHCRIAFTFMRPRADGRAAFTNASPLVNLWLRLRNEPFAWAIDPDDIPALLARRGLRSLDIADHRVLRSHLPPSLATAPLAEGELICLAAP